MREVDRPRIKTKKIVERMSDCEKLGHGMTYSIEYIWFDGGNYGIEFKADDN